MFHLSGDDGGGGLGNGGNPVENGAEPLDPDSISSPYLPGSVGEKLNDLHLDQNMKYSNWRMQKSKINRNSKYLH